MKYRQFNETDIGDSAVAFFDKLAYFESSNNYKLGLKPNKDGTPKKYIGRYQLGVDILIDIGWMKTTNSKNPSWENSTFINYPLQKWKIKNKIDFLNCEGAQDEAIMHSLKKRWATISKHKDKICNYHLIPSDAKYLFFKKDTFKTKKGNVPVKNNVLIKLQSKKKQGFIAEDMIGKKILFTSSGLLAAAHLCGQGAMNNALSNNFKGAYGIPVDGNCLPSLFYAENLKGYDLSVIIGFKDNCIANSNVVLKNDSKTDNNLIQNNSKTNITNNNKSLSNKQLQEIEYYKIGILENPTENSVYKFSGQKTDEVTSSDEYKKNPLENEKAPDKVLLPSSDTVVKRLDEKFNNENLYNHDYIKYLEDKTNKKIYEDNKKEIEHILKKYDLLTKDKDNIGYIIKQENFDILRGKEEIKENLCLVDFIYYIFSTPIKNKNFLETMEFLLEEYTLEQINKFELNIHKKDNKNIINYRCYKFIKEFENGQLGEESYKTDEKSNRKYNKTRQLIDNIIIEYIQIMCSFKNTNENKFFDEHKENKTNIVRNYLLWKVEHTKGAFLFENNNFYKYLEELKTEIRITTILKYWIESNSVEKKENILKISSLVLNEYNKYTNNSTFDKDKQIIYSLFNTLKDLRDYTSINDSLNLYNFYKGFYDIQNNITPKNEFYVNDNCTLRCSCAPDTSKLIISNDTVLLYENKQANINDTTITPFKSCSINRVCTPKLLNSWAKKTDVQVRNAPALLHNSTINCNIGGIITIQDAGQNQIATAITESEKYKKTTKICDCNYKTLNNNITYINDTFIKKQLYKKHTKDTILSLFKECYKSIKQRSNPQVDNMNIVKKYGMSLCDYENEKFYNAKLLPVLVYSYLFSFNNIEINENDKQTLLLYLNEKNEISNNNLFNQLNNFNVKFNKNTDENVHTVTSSDIENWIKIGKNIYFKVKNNINDNDILNEIRETIQSTILCPFKKSETKTENNNNNNSTTNNVPNTNNTNTNSTNKNDTTSTTTNNNNKCTTSNCLHTNKVDRAPWMKILLEEYNKYKGKTQSEEPLKSKISVYHKEGANLNASYSTYWCASFANWCLKKAKVNNWNSASSQNIRKSKNMKKITEPLYGAIINLHNFKNDGKENWQGHSSFLIGESTDGKYYIGLGGNQKKQIKISKYPKSGVSYKTNTYTQKFEGLYWPTDYPIRDVDKLTKNDKFDPDNLTIDKTR